MIISMTFRLPYGAYGVIYAVILSRESVEATAGAVRMVIIGLVLAGAYIVLGMMLVLGDPTLRFLWITGGFFIAFWALSAFRSYSASIRFGYLIGVTITLWDRHATADSKIENTLWAMGIITLASVITLLLEITFAALKKSDPLIDPIVERLTCVEQLLTCYLTGAPVSASVRTTLARLAMTGTSRMRQTLRRSAFNRQYAVEMNAVVGLVGRLVDLAANLPHLMSRVPETGREQLAAIAEQIKEIREHLTRGTIPDVAESAA
jgi:multidrug resistance protein MdtO